MESRVRAAQRGSGRRHGATSRRSGGARAHPEVVCPWIAIAVITVSVGTVTGAAHLGAATATARSSTRIRSRSPKLANGARLADAATLGADRDPRHRRAAGPARRRCRTPPPPSRQAFGVSIARPAASAAGATWSRSAQQLRQTAKRLGVETPGLVSTRAGCRWPPLYQGWEDVSVDVWRPRVGRRRGARSSGSSEAPGAVVVTSNKRDIVDATRELRGEHGRVSAIRSRRRSSTSPVLVVEPTDYVARRGQGRILADLFADACRDPGRPHRRLLRPRPATAYLAGFLLAAAIAERPLDAGVPLADRPDRRRARRILEDHGYPLLATALRIAVVNAPEAARRGLRHRAADRLVHDQPPGDRVGHRRLAAEQRADRRARGNGRPPRGARRGRPHRLRHAGAARCTPSPRRAAARPARWSLR